MNWFRYGSCVAVLVLAFAMNVRAQTPGEAAPPSIKEDDRPAPVDYGFGPGVRSDRNRKAVQEMMAAPSAAAAPVAGADALDQGRLRAAGHVATHRPSRRPLAGWARHGYGTGAQGRVRP